VRANSSPSGPRAESTPGALLAVKLLHTLVWAFFAGCILSIPILGWTGRYLPAALVSGIVFVEVLVLVLDGWQCPLTRVAARYTDERRDNFDIYLPGWLARHNKWIFGILYVAGMFVTVALWAGWLCGARASCLAT
jgi:uncharacterized membrane protein